MRLREKVIEVTAYRIMVDDLRATEGSQTQAIWTHLTDESRAIHIRNAEAALDAILDTLSENHLEWGGAGNAWCEPHDSASHRPDGVSFRCDVWVAALAADGVEPFEPCRMVPSLRIPLSALRIADPGEEE